VLDDSAGVPACPGQGAGLEEVTGQQGVGLTVQEAGPGRALDEPTSRSSWAFCLGCRSVCRPGESGVPSQVGVALIVLARSELRLRLPWTLAVPDYPRWGAMTALIRQRVALPASDEAADVRRSAAGHDRAMDVGVLPAKPRHAGCGLLPLPRLSAHDHDDVTVVECAVNWTCQGRLFCGRSSETSDGRRGCVRLLTSCARRSGSTAHSGTVSRISPVKPDHPPLATASLSAGPAAMPDCRQDPGGRDLYALVPGTPGPDDDSPPADHAQHGDRTGSTGTEPAAAPTRTAAAPVTAADRPDGPE
jgi:hypothetical protein